MAKIESWFDCDLKRPVQVQVLSGNVFSLDNNGSRIGVKFYDNGQKTTVTGSVSGRFILANGQTIDAITGTLATVNGQSVAYLDVPQSVLHVPGPLKITIQLTDSSVVTTVAAILATVYQTKTDDEIVPSQQVIDDWNAAITQAIGTQNLAIANQDAKIDDLKSALTSRFYGKKLSIIGDSIDTFNQAGYKIDGYNMYYPALGVTDVNQTWWKKVMDNSGMTMEVNASWSGSRVTDTDDHNPQYPDFYDRVSVIGSPDVIFVTLGTNDSSNSVALGDYDFTTIYTSLSESTFRTAYIKGIKALQALYPSAEIVCISEMMGEQYRESIEYIAKRLSVKYIDASDYIGSSGVHPGITGMSQIASLVLYPTDNGLWQKHYPADASKVGELQNAISEIVVGKTAVLPTLKFENGYYDGSDGTKKAGGHFIRSISYLDTSVRKKISIDATAFSDLVAIFLTLHDVDGFVKNITFTTASTGKSIQFIVPGNIVKVYLNFMGNGYLSPELGKELIVSFDYTDTDRYEVHESDLIWAQGLINSSTGVPADSANGIYTKNFIRIYPDSVVDIRFKSAIATRVFYLLKFDTNLNYLGTITKESGGESQTFTVKEIDGYMQIAIYDSNGILESEGATALDITFSTSFYRGEHDVINSNACNYISTQDYFETALDHFDIVWAEGVYLDSEGDSHNYANAAVSGLLKVEPGAYYQINLHTVGGTYEGNFIYYDDEFNLIGNLEFTPSTMYFKMPNNCHYVRINTNINYYKDIILVRPSHIKAPHFTREDDRIFIDRWFTNRYEMDSVKAGQRIQSGILLSDFVEVEPSTYYVVPPQSSLYGHLDYVISQYDSNKDKIETSTHTIKHCFTTDSTCKYIRFNIGAEHFKKGACYIQKSNNKTLDTITPDWRNGYINAQTGSYSYNEDFMSNETPIDTSVKKQVDVYMDDFKISSMFISLFNGNDIIKNVSFNYTQGHVTYKVPSKADRIYINFMASTEIDVPESSEKVTVCLSECQKKHFSIPEYVESSLPDRNFILRSSSKSNILPLGLDYNVNDIHVAFSKQDVSADLNERGLDAPCVFWDSIKCRWGITFTGYRTDNVSEYGSIYTAHSDDLENWVQDGMIIERNLDDPNSPDYGTVGGSYVFIKDETYYVFYDGGSIRGFEAGKYSICLATGTDLQHLTKHPNNPILIGVHDGQWYSKDKLYRPSVVQWGDGTYYMFMNALNADNTGNGKWHEYIGYAVSNDLISWEMQGRILDDIPELACDHSVVGDPCLYDVGDEYIYSTLFTCFNEEGMDWSKQGVGIMRTLKKDFPVGWKMIKNIRTGHPKTKPFVVYKDRVQYAFMVDTNPNVYYRTSTT